MSRGRYLNLSEVSTSTKSTEVRHIAERLVDVSSFLVSQAAGLHIGTGVFSVRLDPSVRVSYRGAPNEHGYGSELLIRVDREGADPITWRSSRCGQIQGFEAQILRPGRDMQDVMLMRSVLNKWSTLFIDERQVARPHRYAPLIERIGRDVLTQEFSVVCGLEVVKKLQTEARDWARSLACAQQAGRCVISGGYATNEAATAVWTAAAYSHSAFVVTAQEWRQGIGGSLMRLHLPNAYGSTANEKSGEVAITEFSCISEPMIAAISSVIQEKTA